MSFNSSDPYWNTEDFFDIQDYIATEFFLNVQKASSPREVFHVFAEAHHEMPLFPVTFIAHCILVALKLKDDAGLSNSSTGAAKFIYFNPAVSLLAFILSVQFGCMSTAVLLGGVPVQCYLGNGDIPTVGVAAGVWFLVFFSPFDLFYKICNISLVKMVLNVLGYLRKTRNVMSGVLLARQQYPNEPLVMVVVGMMQGTGSLMCTNLFKLLCVKETPQREHITDKTHVTFTTKMCFLLAVTFTLCELGVVQVSRPLVLFSGALFVIVSKIASSALPGGGDVFSLPATILWKLATFLSPTGRQGVVRRRGRERDHEKED